MKSFNVFLGESGGDASNQTGNLLLVPTDADVVEFFTNAFPDIHLVSSEFLSNEEDRACGEVARRKAEGEELYISYGFLALLREAIAAGAASRLSFLFVAMLLHGLGHSILRWYSTQGEFDNSQLDRVNMKAGIFIEEEFFGGILTGEAIGNPYEFSLQNLKEVGLRTCGRFYPVDDKLAEAAIELSVSTSLPVIDITTLSPVALGTGHSRYNIVCMIQTLVRSLAPLAPLPPKKMTKNIYSISRGCRRTRAMAKDHRS